MAIEIACPHCKETYRLPETQIGKHVRCRKCGDTFPVEQEDQVPVLEEATTEDLRRNAITRREDDNFDRDRDTRVQSRSSGPPLSRSRRDEEDDRDFGRDDQEEPRGSGSGLLILLGVGAFLLVLLVGGGGLTAYLLMPKSTPSAPSVASTAPPFGDLDKAVQEAMNKGLGNIPDGNNPGGNNPGGNNPGGNPRPIQVPRQEEKPPQDVTAALACLRDSKASRKQEGVSFLARAPIEELRRDEVGRALDSVVDEEPSLAGNVLPVLRKWAPHIALDRLIKRVKDPNAFTANNAMDELSQIDDDRAAEAIVGQLKVFGRGHHAARNLERMGKRAEKFVLPLYNDRDTFIRGDARAVLRTIGTKDEDIFKQTVDDLNSTDIEKRKHAVDELVKHKPRDRQTQERVAKALESMFTVKDFILPGKALDALETWATNDNVPALLELLGDPGKINQVLKVLAKLKDERMIKPLVLRLNSPQRLTIAKIVLGYGEAAEELVQIQLRNLDQETRLTAVDMLGEIGTKKSIPILQRYQAAYKREAAKARAAIQKIQAREKEKMEKGKDK
jgi:predicted Zn finger-like uncharacterized protein